MVWCWYVPEDEREEAIGSVEYPFRDGNQPGRQPQQQVASSVCKQVLVQCSLALREVMRA